jgi:cytochrome c5
LIGFPLAREASSPKGACGRGRSSAGRASQWHCEGQGFDPPRLHHPPPELRFAAFLKSAGSGFQSPARAALLLHQKHSFPAIGAQTVEARDYCVCHIYCRSISCRAQVSIQRFVTVGVQMKQRYTRIFQAASHRKDKALKLPVIAAAAAVLTMMASGAQADNGQAIYTQHCAMCHAKIPPKLGDKAAWAPRIKKGIDALVADSVKGKGAMPPQVGKTGLTEAQVRAAVEYMVEHSK